MASENSQEQLAEFARKLFELDTGGRTALKRDAGKKLNEAGGNALAAFYKVLPFGVGQWKEGRFFTVGCLICMWKKEEVKIRGMLFESCLKQIRSQGYESFDSRVRALLDTDWNDDDGYLIVKLARIAKQMKQKNVLPDFQHLLMDLIHWNDENRWVQRKWARTYFEEGQTPENINGEGN